MRRAAKVDENQPKIVKALRDIPGVTVEVGHDDILVGYSGVTYWFELKAPSAEDRDGNVRQGEKKPSQIKLEAEWAGHYRIVSRIDQILEDMGI